MGVERAVKKSCPCASFLRPGVINEKTALLIHFENKFQNFICCLFFHFTTIRNSRSAGELVVTFFITYSLSCFHLNNRPTYFFIFLPVLSAKQVPPLAPEKNKTNLETEKFSKSKFVLFFNKDWFGIFLLK